MPKLKRGAVTVDLVDGSIHGDLDHCPRDDLLESAQALLSLLPHVKHKGLWGLGKAYDADCHLCTTAKRYRLPEGLALEAETGHRPFQLRVIESNRERYWRFEGSEHLIGSIRDGQVCPDTEGLPDHYQPPEPPTSAPPRCPNCAVDLITDKERSWVKTCPQCGFAYVGMPPKTERQKEQKKPTPPSQQLTLPM